MSRLSAAIGLLLTILVSDAAPQSLAVRRYGIGEGLIHDIVGQVSIDSRGFIWVSTGAGVSRFDGYGFVNYSTSDGLPDVVANQVYEDRRGQTWVPTNGGGLARFRDQPDATGSLFDVFPVGSSRRSNRVNRLLDAHGRLWAATDEGLFQASSSDASPSFTAVALDVTDPSDTVVAVFDVAEGADGTLWLGTSMGLVQRLSSGRTVHYRFRDRQRHTARVVAVDKSGLVWVAHADVLAIWAPATAAAAAAGSVIVDRQECEVRGTTIQLPATHGGNCVLSSGSNAGTRVPVVMAGGDGSVFAARRGDGLVEVRDHDVRQVWAVPDGLTLHNMAQDRQGHVWIATDYGLHRLLRSGSRIWRDNRFGPFRILGLADAGAGSVYAMGTDGWIHRVSDRGVESVRPRAVSRAMTATLVFQTPMRDRSGGWWIGTGQGLYRFGPVPFEALEDAEPIAIYRDVDGLPSNLVGRLFEDSRGDLWIASRGNNGEVAARWQRATGRIHRYTPADGIPLANVPYAFAEDADGHVWVAFRDGGLGRFAGDRFQMIVDDAIRGALVQALHTDVRGRLWVGTRTHGLLRIDRPDEFPWRVVRFTEADGLQNGGVSCLVESAGDIYAGGIRGIDRIEPDSGRISHLLPDEGQINVLAALDQGGQLWFGTTRGVSQFSMKPEHRTQPPGIRIRAVRVAGIAWPLSPLGAQQAGGIRTDASRNRVEVEFFGLDDALDGTLRYQTRLEGADRDWAPPTSQRAVTYANLRPGHYRFMVRAVNASGHSSETPAVVAFSIEPPLWQRWWFISTAGMLVVGLVYAMYRYRLRHVLAVERVRTRIAADLHDDIGSNLSKVTLLSEVVKRDAAVAGTDAAERLASIASIANGSIESMSDIVWAVDPTKDRMTDLVRRMRSFAEEQFVAAGVSFTLNLPDDGEALTLGADIRREVLLIFKEAVNNLVRHARCRHARVDMRVVRGRLELSVEDDGSGFVESESDDGHGLMSMRARAARLGGTLTVASYPGRGTRVLLTTRIRGAA